MESRGRPLAESTDTSRHSHWQRRKHAGRCFEHNQRADRVMTPSLSEGSFAKFHTFDFKHGGAVVRDGQTLVCARLSPPPALALSLSLHRHPYLCIPLSSRFIRYNKPLKNLKPARDCPTTRIGSPSTLSSQFSDYAHTRLQTHPKPLQDEPP